MSVLPSSTIRGLARGREAGSSFPAATRQDTARKLSALTIKLTGSHAKRSRILWTPKSVRICQNWAVTCGNAKTERQSFAGFRKLRALMFYLSI